MAVIGTLHKVVFGGTLAVTETWSCSVHMLTATPTDLTFAPLDAAIKAWIATTGTNLNVLAKYEWIKANAINPATGKYVDQTGARTFFTATPVSGAAGTGDPAATVAVTTRTSNTRGLGHAGRFFPPVFASSLGTDGLIQPSTATAMANGAKALLTGFIAAGGAPVVFSRRGQVANVITGVSVGRVIDHQNRRRRNLLETYVNVSL